MELMYSEVDELLHYLGDAYIDKIPKEIISYIEQNKDKNYKPKINNHIYKFEDIGLSSDALALIAYFNLEFWTDEKTKQELNETYGCCQQEAVALDLFIADFNGGLYDR
ncbi:MAG: hypothetical protein LUF02_08510 [Erysipelotrichaceae bacterium]|nr:hypothetical protein [Erysipelotrichaceae bacterium]